MQYFICLLIIFINFKKDFPPEKTSVVYPLQKRFAIITLIYRSDNGRM